MVNELGEIGSAGAPISSQVPSPAAEVQRRSWREWLGVWAVGAGTLVVAPLFTQLVGDWFSAPRTEISGFVSGGHTSAGGGSAWLDEEGNQVSISYSYLWLLNTGETPVSVTGIDLPARYAMGDARYCADRHGSLQPGQSQLVLLVRGGSDSSGLSDADGPLTAYTLLSDTLADHVGVCGRHWG